LDTDAASQSGTSCSRDRWKPYNLIRNDIQKDKMKYLKNIFLLEVTIALVCNSCVSTYHYFPPSQPSPSYHQKNEIQYSGSIGFVNNMLMPPYIFTMPICFDNYFGYSISNNIYFDIKTAYTSENSYQDGDYKLTYFNTGIGLGYYKWVNQILFGSRLGFSYGDFNIRFMEYYYNGDYFKADNKIFSLLPFIGYEIENTQIIFQINYLGINYSKIKNVFKEEVGDNHSKIKEFKQLNNPFTEHFIEPSFSLKSGNKYFKFVFQEILSYHLGNNNLNYMKANSYIGIELTFKPSDIKSILKKVHKN
jgi:hypothetical protein